MLGLCQGRKMELLRPSAHKLSGISSRLGVMGALLLLLLLLLHETQAISLRLMSVLMLLYSDGC